MCCYVLCLAISLAEHVLLSFIIVLQRDWSSITRSRGRSDPNTQLGVRLVAGKLMLCRPDNTLESHRLV
jgi:hypothetical protein